MKSKITLSYSKYGNTNWFTKFLEISKNISLISCKNCAGDIEEDPLLFWEYYRQIKCWNI